MFHHGRGSMNFSSHRTKEHHKSMHLPNTLLEASDRQVTEMQRNLHLDVIAFLTLERWNVEDCQV
jgi:hypothetical protein